MLIINVLFNKALLKCIEYPGIMTSDVLKVPKRSVTVNTDAIPTFLMKKKYCHHLVLRDDFSF